jgi:hypothetical protein
MTSLAQSYSNVGPDAIALQDVTAIESKKTKLNEKRHDIEYADPEPTDLPAVVDIHGDVIKADWHTIRAKANEAEEYEHSLGLWQAMKSYKKVHSSIFAIIFRSPP